MKAEIKFTRTFVGNAITDVTSFKKYLRVESIVLLDFQLTFTFDFGDIANI